MDVVTAAHDRVSRNGDHAQAHRVSFSLFGAPVSIKISCCGWGGVGQSFQRLYQVTRSAAIADASPPA